MKKSLSELTTLINAPLDENNEVIFANPWEAKAFALVVQMHQEKRYTWTEWANQLSFEISESNKKNEKEEDYYLLWLKAAETLVVTKGLCGKNELLSRKKALLQTQEKLTEFDNHNHGNE
jgi:nitrile hydratase accessory protein